MAPSLFVCGQRTLGWLGGRVPTERKERLAWERDPSCASVKRISRMLRPSAQRHLLGPLAAGPVAYTP